MGAKFTMKKEQKRLKRIIKAFESSVREVRIGFMDTEIAKIALFHEIGTKDRPATPFMRTAFMVHRQDYISIMQDGMIKVFNGQTNFFRITQKVGIAAKGHVQESITNKGLVETGAMRANVAYQVIV